MAHLPHRDIFFKHIAPTSSIPLGLEVERAEGVFIYDTSGKKYFDLNSGISVSSLGHRHPKVISAIKDQLELHMHTMVYGEHIQLPQTRYAELIFKHLNQKLNSIYFLNSGSEVIEAGMKLIKRSTGRYKIISCRNAYHGSTQGAESLRSDLEYSRAYLPLIPGIEFIEFNNLADLSKIDRSIGGVIVEAVQAEAGVILPENGFLNAVRQRCDETGTLLMFDEIQTGFGRTGKLFAHQKYNVVPDILAIGKAMGGGMPIGGLIANNELMVKLSKDPGLGHISTFGGHPITTAAAFATLEVLTSTDIIEEVENKERFIRDKLNHPVIKEIRSSGLMMAVELTKRKYLKHVVGRAYELGALVDYFLFNNKSFRLAPPLIYTFEELEEACAILMQALDFAKNKYA